jgi:hypothetical protein
MQINKIITENCQLKLALYGPRKKNLLVRTKFYWSWAEGLMLIVMTSTTSRRITT